MPDDPYLWLEDVEAEAALDWARERNAKTFATFTEDERFHELEAGILAMLDTDERIPYVAKRGEWLYNFWRDADHPKGLWRRTTMAEYRNTEPEWDVLIDVDALAAAEDENWVWAGAAVLRPLQDRVLISLSRGGADATVVREFDLVAREFKTGGFELPEAKSRVAWIDADTVYVGTDFGPGSMTDSGYPRIAKRWKRGTPLAAAETVFEGAPTDVSVSAAYDRTPGFERHFVGRATDFFNEEVYLVTDAGLELIDAPTDAHVDFHKQWLLVRTRTPWELGETTYPAGALLVFDAEAFRRGDRDATVLFAPDEHTAFTGGGWTENYLLLVTLQDVRTKLHVLTPGSWAAEPLTAAPDFATTSIFDLDPIDGGDEFMLVTSGFTNPATLLHSSVGGDIEPLKRAPAFFDADGIVSEQFFAESADGTQVPYFVVRRAGVSGPAILSGYGGFEISRTPDYSGASGMAWLTRGGISVVANIRGGGEYGPQWHTQAQRAGKPRSYEDFAAVAQDLVARGITTPAQLGAIGGSNGGLLIGVMLTRYPELFGALVCQVPLLDMQRYHLLLAGASWVAEYGDPDNPDDWAFMSKYSPYQNTRPDATYPPILLTTSTRDDRVHPGHARKMAARLEEYGHEVWYYENIEGGHGGAADNKQAAFQTALAYRFFDAKLR